MESPTLSLEELPWPFPIYTTDPAPISNSTTSQCIGEKALGEQLEVSLLCSAAAIILVLNILLPRWRGRTVQSLLDLVVPIKFLDSTPFRLIYCLAMSCWAGDVLKSVSDSSQFIRSTDRAVLDAFDFFIVSPSVIILKQSLSYFPVLACVDGPVPWLSHSLGFLHTLLLGSTSVYRESVELRGCSGKGALTTRDMVFSVLISLPVYLIYIVIAGWFLFHALLELPLVLCTRQKCYQKLSNHYDNSRHHLTYVSGLFKRHLREVPLRIINLHTLRSYLVRGLQYVLPFHEGFSYPLPFLSALSMSTLLIYQLGLSLSYASVSYTEELMEYVREFNITIETVERFLPQLSSRLDNLFYDAKSLVLAFNIILPLAVFISFSLTIAFMGYMAQHYHKLLLRASQGDLSFLVKSEPLPSVPYRLAATMRYTAFQCSYIVFTWFVYFMMMSSLMSFGLIFYILFKNFQQLGVHLWSWFMIPLLWSGVMHQVQVFLCHFVFLENKTASKTYFVPIRFKSLYQVLSYWFLFFNFIYGIMMCFLRVFGVVIFTVVMLFRMDWDVYMRGLEGWDVGCRTFVGYMYVECTNNNPIVRTFVTLLQDSLVRRPLTTPVTSTASDHLANGGSTNINAVVKGTRVPVSRQARNRWLVAYTLLRNPSLQNYTSSSLSHSNSDYGSV